MPQFEMYKDVAGYFRWRLRARNGRIIADSGESYVNKSDCLAGIRLVQTEGPIAKIEDQTLAAAYR
jgi:uncharacterized protein YegP (UPF0339 family)